MMVKMITKNYYLEDCKKTDEKLELLTILFCWTEIEMVEMNYLKIEVTCRADDADIIDRIMND